MSFIIYMHTITNTNKSYIGFTGNTMEFRLNKHILNATTNHKTKFYNAIRKYGSENIVSKILETVETREEAIAKEIFYIQKYDTFKTGYNSTLGGDGGNIIQLLSPEKLVVYLKQLSERNLGTKNPNSCKLTNEELIDEGVKCYLENNNTIRWADWLRYAKKHKLPQNFTKFRFEGKGKLFLKLVHDRLGIEFIDKPYQFSEEHKKNIRLANKNSVWLNNGIKSKLVKQELIEKHISEGWSKGRTIK